MGKTIVYDNFEWDEEKTESIVRSHGIDFEEAKSVFYDVRGILFDDPDHSEYEDR